MASSSSSSSKQKAPVVVEEEQRGPFISDYLKLDFTSDQEGVYVNFRSFTQSANEEDEQEFEEEFEFYRDENFVKEDAMGDIVSFLIEAETKFPVDYVDHIVNLTSSLLKDNTEYDRLLWDAHPDNEGPSVPPRVITNESVKKYIDVLTKLPGMSFR